jgi:hypothetical protein
MENADSAVLSSLESDLLHPRALELGLQRAVARITRPPMDETDVATEQRRLERELSRSTKAIAAGGGTVPALVAALQSREARRELIGPPRRVPPRRSSEPPGCSV